jgi:hypothetical protein
MRSCEESMRIFFELVDNMLDLSNEGYTDREEPGFGVIYSVVRDSAYKIKKLAEAEKDALYNENRCIRCGIRNTFFRKEA